VTISELANSVWYKVVTKEELSAGSEAFADVSKNLKQTIGFFKLH
jgi:hypothetical protein